MCNVSHLRASLVQWNTCRTRHLVYISRGPEPWCLQRAVRDTIDHCAVRDGKTIDWLAADASRCQPAMSYVTA